jgi:hypothetical protein
MLWVPTLRLLVLQVTILELLEPAGNVTAPQPLSVVPSAVKATLPVGALPLTVAVKVTLAPANDGLPELARLVLLAVGLLTTCDNVALADPLLAASPA